MVVLDGISTQLVHLHSQHSPAAIMVLRTGLGVKTEACLPPDLLHKVTGQHVVFFGDSGFL